MNTPEFQLIKSTNDLSILKAEFAEHHYNGYYWLSDRKEPIVLMNEPFPFESIPSNPFVIEANVFSQSAMKSATIRQIDSLYISTIVSWHELPTSNDNRYQFHYYLSDPALFRQNPELKFMKFVEFWQESYDSIQIEMQNGTDREIDILAGMPVLKPAWTAFLGFSAKGDLL